MGALFAIALLVSPTLPEVTSALAADTTKLPRNLFRAVSTPSGYRLCDKRQRLKQERRFEQKYGERVSRLAKAILEKDGPQWASDEIISATCAKASKRDLAQSLDQFEFVLQNYEDKYGLSGIPLSTIICKIPEISQDKTGSLVRVRGGEYFAHPESGSWIIGDDCIVSTSIADREILNQLSRRDYPGRIYRITFATFVGRVGSRSCVMLPSGATCGPLLSVRRVEDIVHSDQCWTSVRNVAGAWVQRPGKCPD